MAVSKSYHIPTLTHDVIHNNPSKINDIYPDGDTLLHKLVKYGDIDLIKQALAAGDIKQKDRWGRTPLMLAISIHKISIINLLMEHHSVDIALVDNNGEDLLHYAVTAGNYNLTEKLIGLGFNINKKDNHENTPLSIAINNKFIGIIELLLKHNAKIDFGVLTNTILTEQDRLFYRMFNYIEKELDDQNIFKLATIAIDNNNNNNNILEHIINSDVERTKRLLNFRTSINNTLLSSVIINKNFNMTKKLLDFGADVNQACNANNRPLHFAVRSSQLEMVELLLNYGADKTLTNDYGNTAGNIARRLYCVHGDKMNEIAKLIEEHQSLPDVKEPAEYID